MVCFEEPHGRERVLSASPNNGRKTLCVRLLPPATCVHTRNSAFGSGALAKNLAAQGYEVTALTCLRTEV